MDLIYPLFAMVLLTFAVGLGLGAARVRSVRKGQVDVRYFRLLSGVRPPDYVAKLENNFANLFEVPVLFYAVGGLAVALGIQSPAMLTLGWLYVGLRVIHTGIHISYNNPLHRFLPFLLSTVIVVVMWVQLIVIVNQGG